MDKIIFLTQIISNSPLGYLNMTAQKSLTFYFELIVYLNHHDEIGYI